MLRWLLPAALLSPPHLAQAAALRPRPGPGAALAQQALSATHRQSAGAQKVGRLIADIDSSVRKEAQDGEIVFATLLNYDGEVEASLRKELQVLNQTLGKLTTMQGTYAKTIQASQIEVRKLRAAKAGSQQQARRYMEGSQAARNEFDRLLTSVGNIITELGAAAITPSGQLIMQTEESQSQEEVSKVYASIRKLLAGNRAIRPLFPDVFNAFMPTTSLTQATLPQVRMYKALLGRTISALQTIKSRLQSQRAKALLQVSKFETRLAIRSSATENGVQARQGIQANKQENVEELAFSRTFTGAVMKIDQGFFDKVIVSMKTKAQCVETIRRAREQQERTLTDLIDLLDGRYSLDDPSHEQPEDVHTHTLPVSLSFVETGVSVSASHRQQLEGLQFEIETALHNKADTHNILLRVKSMLDDAAPLDAGSMQNVVAEMEGVLRTADDAHERAGDAKQKCESEELHGAQAEQGSQVNLALMSSVRNNTRKAIKASKANLKGIRAKTQALERLSKRFSKIVGVACKNLEEQSRDRHTIMIAVQKVGDIAGQALASQKPAVTALLQQLLQDLEAQERGEEAYRLEATAFHRSFLNYVQEYLQLLQERRSHCETSLSALKLYYTDVASDAKIQQGAVKAGGELETESKDLCNSIMDFYQRHSKRRLELSKALRSVLPRVPDALSSGLNNESAWEDIA
jgi:hypothetical protein